MLKKWNDLPEYMRTDAVRPYYDRLNKKRFSLAVKRGFDFMAAVCILFFLLPVLVSISLLVALDSKGGVFFRQERVTQYGRKFMILKFRTMDVNAQKIGGQITLSNDKRVTRAGRILRKYRLDELPQLYNILLGDMSFCGTRPEVPRFVRAYTKEMMATLLLPAGITSEASIRYKDESRLLENAKDADNVYVSQVLPGKMKYNLQSIKNFSLLGEIGTMVKTVFAVWV